MAATASIGMFGDKVVIGALDTSFNQATLDYSPAL